MANDIKVDYSALQGEAFFDTAKGLLDYYAAQMRNVDLDEKTVAGNAAVYGFIAHKRILLNSISTKADNDQNLYSLFRNTETMLHNLGVKFEQMDTAVKNAIENGHGAGA